MQRSITARWGGGLSNDATQNRYVEGRESTPHYRRNRLGSDLRLPVDAGLVKRVSLRSYQRRFHSRHQSVLPKSSAFQAASNAARSPRRMFSFLTVAGNFTSSENYVNASPLSMRCVRYSRCHNVSASWERAAASTKPSAFGSPLSSKRSSADSKSADTSENWVVAQFGFNEGQRERPARGPRLQSQ